MEGELSPHQRTRLVTTSPRKRGDALDKLYFLQVGKQQNGRLDAFQPGNRLQNTTMVRPPLAQKLAERLGVSLTEKDVVSRCHPQWLADPLDSDAI